MKRLVLVTLGVVALVAAAIVGFPRLLARHVPAGQQGLLSLGGDGPQDVRDELNAHLGEVRVLALLSPT